jgi:hypothetical protein
VHAWFTAVHDPRTGDLLGPVASIPSVHDVVITGFDEHLQAIFRKNGTPVLGYVLRATDDPLVVRTIDPVSYRALDTTVRYYRDPHFRDQL